MQQLSKFYSQSTRKTKWIVHLFKFWVVHCSFYHAIISKTEKSLNVISIWWLNLFKRHPKYKDRVYTILNIKIEFRLFFFWPDRTIIILVSYLQWWASHLRDICNCVFNSKKKMKTKFKQELSQQFTILLNHQIW